MVAGSVVGRSTEGGSVVGGFNKTPYRRTCFYLVNSERNILFGPFQL